MLYQRSEENTKYHELENFEGNQALKMVQILISPSKISSYCDSVKDTLKIVINTQRSVVYIGKRIYAQ